MKAMTDDALLVPNVQQHSGAVLCPSALLTQYYAVHALFTVSTCPVKRMLI